MVWHFKFFCFHFGQKQLNESEFESFEDGSYFSVENCYYFVQFTGWMDFSLCVFFRIIVYIMFNNHIDIMILIDWWNFYKGNFFFFCWKKMILTCGNFFSHVCFKIFFFKKKTGNIKIDQLVKGKIIIIHSFIHSF